MFLKVHFLYIYIEKATTVPLSSFVERSYFSTLQEALEPLSKQKNLKVSLNGELLRFIIVHMTH